MEDQSKTLDDAAEAIGWAAGALAAQSEPEVQAAPWVSELQALSQSLRRAAGKGPQEQDRVLSELAANERLVSRLESLVSAAESSAPSALSGELSARQHHAEQLRLLLNLLRPKS